MVDIGPWLKWRRTRDHQRVSSSPLNPKSGTCNAQLRVFIETGIAEPPLGQVSDRRRHMAFCSVTLTPPCILTALPSAHQTEISFSPILLEPAGVSTAMPLKHE